jgi:hypothetical protein
MLGMGLASTASAANVPPGLLKKGIQEFTCEGIGTVNIVAASGRTGIDADTGQRYALRTIIFDGTFDPSDPNEPTQHELFTKTYGGGPSGPTIACTGEINDSGPEGTFTATIDITVVPIPGG